MGDQTHIIELIDQILEATSDQPKLQEMIFDLRDALFQAQQAAQQHALKVKTLEETIRKLKSPAHRIGTILGSGEDDLYRIVVGGTEYQAAVSPDLLEKGPLQAGDQVALNEGFIAIAKLPLPDQGPLVRLSSRLKNGSWLAAGGTGSSETIVAVHPSLDPATLRESDEVILDPNQKVILAKLPKRETSTVVEDDFTQGRGRRLEHHPGRGVWGLHHGRDGR